MLFSGTVLALYGRLFRTEKSSESCRGILDRMAISCRGKDTHYEFRSVLSLCPVSLTSGQRESRLTGSIDADEQSLMSSARDASFYEPARTSVKGSL